MPKRGGDARSMFSGYIAKPLSERNQPLNPNNHNKISPIPKTLNPESLKPRTKPRPHVNPKALNPKDPKPATLSNQER